MVRVNVRVGVRVVSPLLRVKGQWSGEGEGRAKGYSVNARSPFLPTPPFLPTEPQLYMAQPWCALKSLRSQSTSLVLRKPWQTW